MAIHGHNTVCMKTPILLSRQKLHLNYGEFTHTNSNKADKTLELISMLNLGVNKASAKPFKPKTTYM